MRLPEESGGDFELCPDGNHLAVCNRVIDLGTQKGSYEGKVTHQHKIYIEWVIPEERRADGEMFSVGKRYTFSSSEKSNLRKDLESWRGKRFKPEDFGPGGFEIKNLLGKACFLQIVHTDKDGKTYANIQSIGSLPKGMSAPSVEITTQFLSLDKIDFDRAVFEGLSEKMQGVIQASPEWSKLTTRDTESTSVQSGKIAEEFEDDEIPF